MGEAFLANHVLGGGGIKAIYTFTWDDNQVVQGITGRFPTPVKAKNCIVQLQGQVLTNGDAYAYISNFSDTSVTILRDAYNYLNSGFRVIIIEFEEGVISKNIFGNTNFDGGEITVTIPQVEQSKTMIFLNGLYAVFDRDGYKLGGTLYGKLKSATTFGLYPVVVTLPRLMKTSYQIIEFNNSIQTITGSLI